MKTRAWTPGQTRYSAAAPSSKATIAQVAGYAAVFYSDQDPGSEYLLFQDADGRVVERLVPGCFDAALQRGDDVICLVNHDADLDSYVARTANGSCTLRADRRGLYYSANIPNTSGGRDLAVLLQRMDIKGSSFSFRVDAERFVQASPSLIVREIRQVTLYDVSPVFSPAYRSTSAALSGLSDDDFALMQPGRSRWAGPLTTGQMRERLKHLARDPGPPVTRPEFALMKMKQKLIELSV